MIPYLILFSIVIAMAFIAQANRTPKPLKKYILVIMIAALSIFGGLRASNIGYDVKVYGEAYFKNAKMSSSYASYIKDKLQASDEEAKDLGYMTLNYVAAKATNNFTVFLTLLQLITNAPVLIVLYRNKDKASFPLSVLAYLCLFYCRNFNALRQGAALSLALLSGEYLSQNKIVRYAILALAAYSFHSTSFIIIIAQILLFLIKNINQKIKNRAIKIAFIISIIAVISIKTFLPILYKYGMINIRTVSYLDRFENDGGLPLTDLIAYTAIAAPSLFVWFRDRKKALRDHNIILSIEGYILYYTRAAITYSDRLSLYFQYYGLLAMPTIMKKIKTSKNRLLYYALVSILLISYWYVKHVLIGAHAVVPYETVL